MRPGRKPGRGRGGRRDCGLLFGQVAPGPAPELDECARHPQWCTAPRTRTLTLERDANGATSGTSSVVRGGGRADEGGEAGATSNTLATVETCGVPPPAPQAPRPRCAHWHARSGLSLTRLSHTSGLAAAAAKGLEVAGRATCSPQRQLVAAGTKLAVRKPLQVVCMRVCGRSTVRT